MKTVKYLRNNGASPLCVHYYPICVKEMIVLRNMYRGQGRCHYYRKEKVFCFYPYRREEVRYNV